MMKSLFNILIICSIFSKIRGSGELRILHAPKALIIHKPNTISTSRLPNFFSVALGLSTVANDTWNGVEIKVPTGFAEALVVIHFPGLKFLNTEEKSDYYLINDLSITEVMNEIESKTSKRFDRNIFFREIITDDESSKLKGQIDAEGGTETFEPLKMTNHRESDDTFMNALNEVQRVITEISFKKRKGTPNVFWVSFPRMADVLNQREKDTHEILLNALEVLTSNLRKSYDDEVLVAVLCESEEVGHRYKREIVDETNTNTTKITRESLNVADDYDENFPIIFNIILWFSVGLLFALIAICMVIASMDPGRDSIIYRMTSTRMKKDN